MQFFRAFYTRFEEDRQLTALTTLSDAKRQDLAKLYGPLTYSLMVANWQGDEVDLHKARSIAA